MATKSSSVYAHSESQGEPNRGRHFFSSPRKTYTGYRSYYYYVFCGGNLLFGYNWTAVTVTSINHVSARCFLEVTNFVTRRMGARLYKGLPVACSPCCGRITQSTYSTRIHYLIPFVQCDTGVHPIFII